MLHSLGRTRRAVWFTTRSLLEIKPGSVGLQIFGHVTANASGWISKVRGSHKSPGRNIIANSRTFSIYDYWRHLSFIYSFENHTRLAHDVAIYVCSEKETIQREEPKETCYTYSKCGRCLTCPPGRLRDATVCITLWLIPIYNSVHHVLQKSFLVNTLLVRPAVEIHKTLRAASS